jgi:hypothetical protein
MSEIPEKSVPRGNFRLLVRLPTQMERVLESVMNFEP